MKRRLYFLIPDPASARQVHNELLLARIEERHMHFMADEPARLAGLPQANLLQKSDVVHGAEMGLGIGGVTGVVAGLVAVIALALSMESAGLVILAVAIAGALVGAWASSMIAVDVPNTQLRQFEGPMADGNILLMVDVAKERVEEISTMVRRYHPEAGARGMEPTIPAFP